MDWACSTYGVADAYWVLVVKSERKEQFKELGVDGSIILKWIMRKLDEDLKWINLAQDRDRWSAVVNAMMNFSVPKNAENFFPN
jgi:hypothetical protein